MCPNINGNILLASSICQLSAQSCYQIPIHVYSVHHQDTAALHALSRLTSSCTACIILIATFFYNNYYSYKIIIVKLYVNSNYLFCYPHPCTLGTLSTAPLSASNICNEAHPLLILGRNQKKSMITIICYNYNKYYTIIK